MIFKTALIYLMFRFWEQQRNSWTILVPPTAVQAPACGSVGGLFIPQILYAWSGIGRDDDTSEVSTDCAERSGEDLQLVRCDVPERVHKVLPGGSV